MANTSVVLSVLQVGITSIKSAEGGPTLYFNATSDDLPSEAAPAFRILRLALSDNLTSDDVTFMNATVTPACEFVSADGADVLYNCSIASSAQDLTWDVLGRPGEPPATCAYIRARCHLFADAPSDAGVALPYFFVVCKSPSLCCTLPDGPLP
jgi:hypothetical protein